MASHHTKDKGDLGVLKAQVDLFEQGFTICLPQTEHSPFDLVAYKNGKFYRVQVKYRALEKNGAFECYYLEPKKFRSNVSLRVKASKNGQAKRVNFAADFRRAP